MPCADNSMVGPGGKVFVLKPDTWTPYDTEPDTLWGQIEHVDRWIPGYGYYGRMAHDGNRYVSHLQVISAVRGPGVSAVRALQRAFRKRRYILWYKREGWNRFCLDVVAFAECRHRVVRVSKINPFSLEPSWGYHPEPAVADWCSVGWRSSIPVLDPYVGGPPLCVPPLGTRRLSHEKHIEELEEAFYQWLEEALIHGSAAAAFPTVQGEEQLRRLWSHWLAAKKANGSIRIRGTAGAAGQWHATANAGPHRNRGTPDAAVADRGRLPSLRRMLEHLLHRSLPHSSTDY